VSLPNRKGWLRNRLGGPQGKAWDENQRAGKSLQGYMGDAGVLISFLLLSSGIFQRLAEALSKKKQGKGNHGRKGGFLEV